MTNDLQDIPPAPTPAPQPTLRSALAELSLSGALVLAEIDSVELQTSWKKKPSTSRLLVALEMAREALST